MRVVVVVVGIVVRLYSTFTAAKNTLIYVSIPSRFRYKIRVHSEMRLKRNRRESAPSFFFLFFPGVEERKSLARMVAWVVGAMVGVSQWG